jgi:hypothetical protein
MALRGRKAKLQRNASVPAHHESEEIARVAYTLWEQRGRVHGHDAEDWQEAERIVRARHTNGIRRLRGEPLRRTSSIQQ